ncbi:hypothetical protein [Kangiella shandongensis]|uniref:hypothetical protein n=1 Tax=Kangiella shandongensis TaxID=2763258 RepID=UPI001CBDDA4E|nr:hypothetical protein [Kangiella shandongensis]
MNDPSDNAYGKSLEGTAMVTTLGASVGIGWQYYSVNFGTVSASGFSITGGFEAGGTALAGHSEIDNTPGTFKRSKCGCKDE